jgi:hypothetical protein
MTPSRAGDAVSFFLRNEANHFFCETKPINF